MNLHRFVPNASKLAIAFATCGGLAFAGPAHAHESDHDGDRSESRRDRGGTRTHIALDMNFGTALDKPGMTSGGGGALRLGQEFDLFLVSLIPELGGSYHAFGGDADARIYAGFLGGRLAVGKIVEPSLFAHLGVGRLEGAEERTAPLLDVGLAVDLTILPLIDLGLHGAYNMMFPRENGSALEWLNLGAHAALVL